MARSDRIMIAAVGGALILAVAAAWLTLTPIEDGSQDLAAGALAVYRLISRFRASIED